MTIDAYLELDADTLKHSELVLGRLVRGPMPGYRHSRVQTRLAAELETHLRAHRSRLVCLVDVGFIVASDPPTVRGPDIALVRKDNLPAGDRAGFLEGAPAIAVEILSPSNRAGEMQEKVAQYLAAGAACVWVVDPEREAVTVHTRAGDVSRFKGSDVLHGGELLPALRLLLSDLFDDV